MALQIRQKEILEIAHRTGRVLVEDLAEQFGVTPQTIRRDLTDMCDRRLLTRVHGGAMLESGTANLGYEARRGIAADEKDRIGRICAAAIPDGSSLFINIGTTTEAVARALLSHRDLLVITNNINVANTLSANPNCEIIVAGGMLRRSDGGLIGEATAEFIKQFKVDFAVVGASAIDEDGSLLDYDYREVRVARTIIEHSRAVYLVADSSKLTRSAPVRIAGIQAIAAFFTDTLPSERLRQVCIQHGVDVFTLDDSGTGANSMPSESESP
ncbi:MAG TPA: DeoR/GlpR family DNA-binding transcription regulator [Thermohalobaculum sp.]|nr:DeoR/GlpR family DNA-binding transcription regulator [Thermohalobaculum sp.]